MLSRRQILSMIFMGLISLPAVGSSVDTWPERSVRFVVPFSAGGGTDLASRIVAERLSTVWGKPIVVENKPGANTVIATQSVLSSPKDGYTLLVTNATTFYLPDVNPTVTIKPLEELTPVAELNVEQLVLVASSDLAANNVSEIAELVREDPASYSFGTYGYGTVAHLVLLELNKSKQLDLIHVPYRGTSPMVQALMAGDIKFGVSNYATVRPFIESGALKPIATTGKTRSTFMPDVPTLHESGISGFEWPQWIGVFAATGTPKPIVEKIAADMSEVLKTDAMTQRLAEMYTMPGTTVLDSFGKVVRTNATEQGAMSKAFGIRMGQ